MKKQNEKHNYTLKTQVPPRELSMPQAVVSNVC